MSQYAIFTTWALFKTRSYRTSRAVALAKLRMRPRPRPLPPPGPRPAPGRLLFGQLLTSGCVVQIAGWCGSNLFGPTHPKLLLSRNFSLYMTTGNFLLIPFVFRMCAEMVDQEFEDFMAGKVVDSRRSNWVKSLAQKLAEARAGANTAVASVRQTSRSDCSAQVSKGV
jgi:hypothetical protein